ncbi:GntR family transcriptional regulator [Saccharopolyspora erythraea NRRL 2338]|uniref:Transcriptional regulator, GntR family n=2 Tax=Saccharopolyspora erythraea TaxID=1836 RepID=A4FMG2_SACEN|nr:FCD domain-containing protein [Saccharopolyspora erythraea]PFG98885.1 GntR family transcriptional regulator [Saccharopolyspora erythraea NRRL 2338]QRK88874.1 FadR family transcriptional regulator [Saccharopolyspora erythraea]CAM05237.1 transcriptional regulator, GntR family [Saccharopolyspora erythraea NRRL 2338]
MRSVGRRSSVDEVISQFNEQLTSGEWKPGERIPTEQELGAELGVSRAVVREAVRALAHLGVLESRQGAGTFVVSAADPTPMLRQVRLAEVRDVFEVQLAYDVQAARLAAVRRDDADVRRLRELLELRDRAEEPDEFGAADADFHCAVVEAARNPLLLEMYRYLLGRLQEGLQTLRSHGDLTEAGPHPHHALLEAIEARDPAAAAEAARAVIQPSLTSLGGVLDGPRVTNQQNKHVPEGDR